MPEILNFFKLRRGGLDWLLVGGLIIFAAASLVSLASSNFKFFSRQLIWYVFSFIIIIFGSRLHWRWFLAQPWFRFGLYWFSVTLLVVSNLQSKTIRGTKSWLVLGPVQFEPSELAKLALIFVLAGFFSRRYLAAWRGKNIFVSLGFALVPAVLTAIHPDFGSAAVIMGIWLGFLLVSGINYKRLAVGLLIATTIAVLLWSFFLKDYQKDRLSAFLFPESDPLGINYNVIQSKIAIGSAGFWGKGFGAGTQTQLGFLPEVQSDFLFAAFIEEWGIFGGVLLILTFLFIIFRIIGIGLRAKSNDFKFVSLGAGLVFTIHFFINVGSNLGLVPVAGVTFPFLSYGGSSLLTGSILISIIQHIKIESSF
ncbi:MAG: FtsW/RodA/SpoVE family cell cycle protein [Patescibacteria group bacterium]